MSIKSLIIDDEPLAINILKNYLQQVEGYEIIETFNNALDGINFVKSNDIDLIFLDINMPVLDGLSFIKSLENPPLIIITTAYDEYAVQTYELDVIDYLLKPIEFPRFMKALNKVDRIMGKSNSSNASIHKVRPHIFIKIDKKKMKKIYLDEMLTIECLKDYLKINTTTGKYIIHSTLSDFTKLLPEKDFIRIHRSYAIAVNKVDIIEGNSLEISGIRYVIGRSYIDKVKKILLQKTN